MRMILIVALSLAAASATRAGYLCDQLRTRGDDELANSCLLDEQDQAAKEQERQQREEMERDLERLRRQTDDANDRAMRMLDQRSREK